MAKGYLNTMTFRIIPRLEIKNRHLIKEKNGRSKKIGDQLNFRDIIKRSQMKSSYVILLLHYIVENLILTI